MNERVVKNPNFKNNGEFHRSLLSRGTGAKGYPNTHTEVEYLGEGKFGASLSTGHRVFFDKADGNKPKKHKLTDERPVKDYVLIQGAKCCVEVYPYYAKYFDVQHEEVRLHEERWVVQRFFKAPDKWRDVDTSNPQIAVEDYPEPAGDVVKVTVTYDTDYGPLTVEYFQRDGNNLKHNVTFQNTSGSAETFRVIQRLTAIAADEVNDEVPPVATNKPVLAFRKADKTLAVAENLRSMVFNEDGSEKTDQCLQRPVSIEALPQGMGADFIYGNWVLAQNESFEIDPDTSTDDDPTEDGWIRYEVGPVYSRRDTTDNAWFGGHGAPWDYDGRAYVEWDISALAGGTLTANPVFKYHSDKASASDEEINPLTDEAPSGATDANLYGYIASGVAYVDPFNIVAAAGQEVDLGASAKTDLQTALTASQSWFALGFQSPADEGVGDGLYSRFCTEEKTDAADPKPTLYVEYTLPAGLENKSANMGSKMVAAGLI